MRPRVCAAIIRNDSILMVRHRDAEHEYWTLPGGGIEGGETPAEAAVREVEEETGLNATVVRFLFEEDYRHGTCRCYLLEVDACQEARPGFDPEDSHLPEHARLLQGVAWHPLSTKRDDGQVAKVIHALGSKGGKS